MEDLDQAPDFGAATFRDPLHDRLRTVADATLDGARGR